MSYNNSGEYDYLAINELNHHPKNKELYGDSNEVDDLVASIEEHGFDEHNPIDVVEASRGDWPKYRIVSGHRRYQAARHVGLEEVPVRFVVFDDEDEEVEYLLRDNRYRQKTDVMLIREGYEYEQRYGDDIDGRTRDAVADRIGKSGEWYRKGKHVMLAGETGEWGKEALDNNAKEVATVAWQRLENGETSVTAAYQEIERAKDSTNNPETPAVDEGDSKAEGDRANRSTDEWGTPPTDEENTITASTDASTAPVDWQEPTEATGFPETFERTGANEDDPDVARVTGEVELSGDVAEAFREAMDDLNYSKPSKLVDRFVRQELQERGYLDAGDNWYNDYAEA